MILTNVRMQKLSQLMFWLLFPGIFFYSCGVGGGFIPAFLGGGVGVFLLLVFIALFPFVIYTSFKLRQIPLVYFIIFICLLLLVSSYLLFHYFYGDLIHQRLDVVNQWLVLLVSWSAIFSIGYFWPKQYPPMIISALIVVLSIMSIIVFANLELDSLVFVLGRDETEDYFLSYQGFARSVTVTGLVLLAVIRYQYIFWAMSGLLLATVFMIGARSELASLLLVFPILIFYQWVEHPAKTIVITLIAIITIGILTTMYLDDPRASRQMKLLNPTESKSFLNRIELNAEALQAIKKNPIGGDFSGHAYSSEGMGHYAHNLLSSWRQLGLIGFLLYSTLMIWPAIGTYHMIIRDPNLLQVDVWRISGVISVFMLLLTLGAKSIFSSVLALSWGIFIAALTQSDSVTTKRDDV